MNDQSDRGASLAGRGQAEAADIRRIIDQMRHEENQTVDLLPDFALHIARVFDIIPSTGRANAISF